MYICICCNNAKTDQSIRLSVYPSIQSIFRLAASPVKIDLELEVELQLQPQLEAWLYLEDVSALRHLHHGEGAVLAVAQDLGDARHRACIEQGRQKGIIRKSSMQGHQTQTS
jgi:hypothetical protein